MTKNIDKPCRCGHPFSMHRLEYGSGDWAACTVTPNSEVWHECIFTLDNLKYLEMMYESR